MPTLFECFRGLRGCKPAWNLGRTSKTSVMCAYLAKTWVLPYLQSCRVVEPDHPLPPNRRWEQLKIDFRILFFSSNVTLVNENTIEAPNYLRWKQVRGGAKVNEGYLRIISITPDTQLVIYDELVDPGPASLPGFVKRWIIEQCLPELIASLRDHV